MNIYPNRKFWEDDLEVPVNHLLDRFHNTKIRQSWINSLSGRQLNVIFQQSFSHKLNAQLFDDGEYDNISVQYKRKVITHHLDSLVVYYLISCFEFAKLEATISEIARSTLTEQLMQSYLLKSGNKYDKKSLLFLLFHIDHNLLKDVYHFEKIQRKGYVYFALQKTPRQPSISFKNFISEQIIKQILTENDIKRSDGCESQLKGLFHHQNRLYVLIRRASDVDLLLSSNKVIHGHKPEWMILDFLISGNQVNIAAKNIDQASEIANSIASRYFSCECIFVNMQDKNFAEQVYKFIKACIYGSDSNIFTFELSFRSNRLKHSNTCITLTVVPHDSIASELHILHFSIDDILVESIKIIFQGKKIGLFFKSSDEYIAIYYSEHPLNKKEREEFKAYMKQSYGLTILSKANL
ncbi:hypothetical protein [Wolbachia endosymbiont (group B) of Melanargia galathea]|uniref:hypothetical protein n=1 Tax=Wolbachia endosymbiont (group B) of Melanargia galathea TaxID=2954029 RepID=UPI00313BFCC0